MCKHITLSSFIDIFRTRVVCMRGTPPLMVKNFIRAAFCVVWKGKGYILFVFFLVFLRWERHERMRERWSGKAISRGSVLSHVWGVHRLLRILRGTSSSWLQGRWVAMKCLRRTCRLALNGLSAVRQDKTWQHGLTQGEIYRKKCYQLTSKMTPRVDCLLKAPLWFLFQYFFT